MKWLTLKAVAYLCLLHEKLKIQCLQDCYDQRVLHMKNVKSTNNLSQCIRF